MERRFIQIYIDHGFIWAARNRCGTLQLYRRYPDKSGDRFISTSPTVNGSRTALDGMLPGVTWENSPVCLPKVLGR